MEETVSVLIWECWLWEDTMDMTDWARLLLAGSSETGKEGDGGQAWSPWAERSGALSPHRGTARGLTERALDIRFPRLCPTHVGSELNLGDQGLEGPGVRQLLVPRPSGKTITQEGKSPSRTQVLRCCPRSVSAGTGLRTRPGENVLSVPRCSLVYLRGRKSWKREASLCKTTGRWLLTTTR